MLPFKAADTKSQQAHGSQDKGTLTFSWCHRLKKEKGEGAGEKQYSYTFFDAFYLIYDGPSEL